MAVEDAEQINAGFEPVETHRVFQEKSGSKAAADRSSGSVSSPASSVESSSVEQRKKVVSDSGSKEKSSESTEISESQLKEITDAINQEFSLLSTTIQFKIEESVDSKAVKETKTASNDTGKQANIKKKEVVISVIDKRTGEVIRQIPPEDLLQSLYNATMFLGMLIDQIV